MSACTAVTGLNSFSVCVNNGSIAPGRLSVLPQILFIWRVKKPPSVWHRIRNGNENKAFIKWNCMRYGQTVPLARNLYRKCRRISAFFIGFHIRVHCATFAGHEKVSDYFFSFRCTFYALLFVYIRRKMWDGWTASGRNMCSASSGFRYLRKKSIFFLLALHSFVQTTN